MKIWTNTAQNPSNLHKRSPDDLLHVMELLEIPECGRSKLLAKMHSDDSLTITMTEDNGLTGFWEFHPVMNMSYNTNGRDYVYTTITAPGVLAEGKYIPILCGENDVYVVYWPNCGNLSTLALKKTHQSYKGDIYINREDFNELPIPGTLALVIPFLLLGMYKWFKQ